MKISNLLRCLVSALAVLAGAVALAADKDLRTRTDAKGETEIGFCSRPSRAAPFNFPGHTFVTFSEARPGAGRTFRSVGHTVAGAGVTPTVFTYFGGKPVAGKQAEERYTDVMQACLTVKVDREVYERAVAAARPTLTAIGLPDGVAAAAESYALNDNDCVDYAMRVAKAVELVGLKVPARAAMDLPADYIAKLKAANK
ncbi:hypothetical protein [Variovorax ginsengisoli]|uniref:Uncharacterized protein n=1 Tax=Variovorax ginsengisoli TaxID=363844 RepID=A0ABT8SGN9_9BURK|nr:hypothetical protein [Variovorax ginsengisoli]MDN8618923.1 hypothetical protein [Variovorax ginsengisoli]MDO1538093.1 hypothetical protein [Variovorax ginsengisoli]